MRLLTLIFSLFALVTCAQPKSKSSKNLLLGCEQTSLYLPDLQGKTVALSRKPHHYFSEQNSLGR